MGFIEIDRTLEALLTVALHFDHQRITATQHVFDNPRGSNPLRWI